MASGDEIWAQIEAGRVSRERRLPDEQSALDALFDAYQRLSELGWRDIIYCPKDGSWFDSISVGSTGIHRCQYSGEWPKGSWWIADAGDLWPSHPAMFRKTPPTDDDTTR